MSIETWKKEFGRSKLSRVKGLSVENLKRHNISALGGKLHGFKRVRSSMVTKTETVFKNGFDDCCGVTNEQRDAHYYWIKTGDARWLIKSFEKSYLTRILESIDHFFTLLKISFIMSR